MEIERAVGRIKAADSLDEIRAIVNAYSARASGDLSALYSGRVGDLSANDIAIDYAEKWGASIINSTPRGQLLAHPLIDNAIQKSASRIFKSQGVDPIVAQRLRADFLYGDASAPIHSPTSIQNCLWCEASRDFASSLRGDVKVIAVNANPNRVFAQVEIPTALQNPHVGSLGGVSVDSLRTTYARQGVEGVLPQVQAAYIKEASLAGLLSTPVVKPLDGVQRAPAATFRVAQVATKALGVASTLYDGVASVRQAAQLVEQGNDTGAQSHIVGAVARSVSGWGGAALGASTGAALSAETGPGALLGGAVGGIAGAIAGDKLAAWIHQHRINHQTDPEGQRWAFDPVHPAYGWTRTIIGELDAHATVDRGVPVYASQTLTAPPDLADRLNYQASSRAVELALSAPPTPRDPYRVESAAEDHRPGNVYEGDWQHDARSGHWSRQVTDSHVGLSMQRFATETAPAWRAAELDWQAHQIVSANLKTTPATIAADYKDAYERFGWSRHGDMPAAVHDAFLHPGRMVASDGQTYMRSDDGIWTTAGALYGRHAADGNVRHELDAAYQRLPVYAATNDESTATGSGSGSGDSGNASAIGALVRKHATSAEHHVAPIGSAHRSMAPTGPRVGRGSDTRTEESAPHTNDRDRPSRYDTHTSSLPAGYAIFDAAEHHRLAREAMERHREEKTEALQRERDASDERRRADERAADDHVTAERAENYRAEDVRSWQDRDAWGRESRFGDERALAERDRSPVSHDDVSRPAHRTEGESRDIGNRTVDDRPWERAPEVPAVMESEHERLMRDARYGDLSAVDEAWVANLDTPRWDDDRGNETILFQPDDSGHRARAIASDDSFPHAAEPVVRPVAPDPHADIDFADPFSYNPYLPGMPEEDKDMADLWLAMQANDMEAVDKAFDVLGQRPEVQQLIDEADRIIEQERIELAARRQAELAEQQRRDEIMRAMREAEAQQHGPVKVLTLGLQPLTAMDMSGGGDGGGDGGGGGG